MLKWCFVCLLVVLLVYPNFNDGFRLRDITSPAERDENKSPKKVQIREPPPFRKIVKVVHVDDDDDEDGNVDDDEDDGRDDDDGNIINDNNDDNTDDSEEDDNEEVIEYKFEKVHTRDHTTEKPQPKKSAAKKEKKKEISSKDQTHDEEEASWFSFAGLLDTIGFGEQDQEPETNGIIDWIKGFKDREEKPSKQIKQAEDDWTVYFNRWPFNVFFPFEKPAPPKTKTKISSKANITKEPEDDEPEPLTPEGFEALLHQLPNFILTPSNIDNTECKKQALIFQRQLKGHKLWTLQMLDASAKISPGILRGSSNQFGDFDICTHIKTAVKVTSEHSVRIKGKYCLTHIEMQLRNQELKLPLYLAHGRGLWNSNLGNPSHFVPRYTVLNWGVCVPNDCTSEDVLQMVKSTLKPYNNSGISFAVDVNEEDCFVRKTQRFKSLITNNWQIGFTIGYFILFTILTILATTIENWNCITKYLNKIIQTTPKDDENEDDNNAGTTEEEKTEDDEETDEQTEESEAQPESLLKSILLSFSVKRSISELVTPKEDSFGLVHLLRIICTIALYVSTKFVMLGHLPITNRDKLVKTLSNPLSITFRSPLIYLDILLFISGFLSSQQMYDEIELKSKIMAIKRFTLKYLRYLPTLFAVLLLQTWILPYIGSGPIWGTLIGENSEICKENMWRNAFGVQNAIDFEETCSPMSIQLAVELQLFLLTPLIVWLYYNNPDVGILIYGGFHAVSVAARYSRTNVDSLSATFFHGMNVSKFYRTANLLFSSPVSRATAYLIGIGLGILIKSGVNGSQIPKTASIIAWVSSIFGVLWCFFYPIGNMYTDFIYNSVDAAVYASWCPLFLTLGLGWIIFKTWTTEYPISLDPVLSSKPLVFLSRLSYPLQLVTFTVVLFSTAEAKESNRFQITDLINFKEILVIVCFTTILALLIDLPFRNIQRLLVQRALQGSSAQSEDEEATNEEETSIDKEETKDRAEECANEDKASSADANDDEEDADEAKDDEEDPGDDIGLIWGTDPEKEEQATFILRKRSVEYEKLNGSPGFEWVKTESADESWRTESDLEQPEQAKNDDEGDEEASDKEDEKEEDDDEEEIKEEDEVIRRPVAPSPVYRRRRWNADED